MRLFWSVTGGAVLGLLGLAAAGTHMVQNRPLALAVVSVTPDLVQLRANTPIASAELTQTGTRVETYGADLYLQPDAPFAPGQRYSVVLDRVTNRFGATTTDVPVSFVVPDARHYFITNEAQLGYYNHQKNTETRLTPTGFLVNEYAVAGDDVYVLGIPPEAQTPAMRDLSARQGLYKWDSETQSLTRILSADRWTMQGLVASPDGQVLSLYRARAGTYAVPRLWLYDTAADTWKPHWDEAFGAGNRVHFSPDNAWLLGVDLATDGYSLSPVTAGPDPMPIGNFFEDMGISPSGRHMLFQTYTDDDVFNGELTFVLFDQNGASENIFLDPAMTPDLIAFDPTEEALWFTYDPGTGMTQIGRYDIKTRTARGVTAFAEPLEIVSLHKPPHSDTVLFGLKEQSITVEKTDNLRGLVDFFFAEGNAPFYSIWAHDLATGQARHLHDGMMLGR